jgi:hypothetical protein
MCAVCLRCRRVPPPPSAADVLTKPVSIVDLQTKLKNVAWKWQQALKKRSLTKAAAASLAVAGGGLSGGVAPNPTITPGPVVSSVPSSTATIAVSPIAIGQPLVCSPGAGLHPPSV